MKRITNIDIYKPIVLYRPDKKQYYTSKKGIITIWYDDGSKSTLDLSLNKDTTGNVNFEYNLIKGKTKVKSIFEEVKDEKIKQKTKENFN